MASSHQRFFTFCTLYVVIEKDPSSFFCEFHSFRWSLDENFNLITARTKLDSFALFAPLLRSRSFSATKTFFASLRASLLIGYYINFFVFPTFPSNDPSSHCVYFLFPQKLRPLIFALIVSLSERKHICFSRTSDSFFSTFR